MKKFVSAQDIQTAKKSGQNSIALADRAIVTPEARDLAKKMNITLLAAADAVGVTSIAANTGGTSLPGGTNDVTLLQTIESAVQAHAGQLPQNKLEQVKDLIQKELQNFQKTTGACTRQINDDGIVLVRGQAVQLDRFPGAPEHNIGIQDVLGSEQRSNMGVGYMGWENAFFPWNLTYDEVDVILEGELHIKTASGTTIGKPGDVIFIPKGSQIEFGTPTQVRFVYITYPADWA